MDRLNKIAAKLPVESAIDNVVTPNEKPLNLKEGELWATHTGIFKIGDFELHCHVLSNGERVFDADDIERLFLLNKV